MLTADDVLNAKFQATKFREGYDQDEVDRFLDHVVATLRERTAGTVTTSPVTVAQIDAQRFTLRKFVEGYDQDEVNDFLDRVRATLAAPAGDHAPAPVAVRAPDDIPGLIRPKGWRRIFGG